jgi:hypothetical protein
MSTISTRICDKCSQGFILTNREGSLPISITLDEANVLDFHVACLASMTLLEWFEVVGGLTQAEVNLIKSWQLTNTRVPYLCSASGFEGCAARDERDDA